MYRKNSPFVCSVTGEEGCTNGPWWMLYCVLTNGWRPPKKYQSADSWMKSSIPKKGRRAVNCIWACFLHIKLFFLLVDLQYYGESGLRTYDIFYTYDIATGSEITINSAEEQNETMMLVCQRLCEVVCQSCQSGLAQFELFVLLKVTW